eukprot:PLAT9589.1.p2 GENE.PLAT9589.1~~PLAT9589.1.p2  ORF type:complete len:396 (-),score=185.08 PLAT9589.1:132-1319(-)
MAAETPLPARVKSSTSLKVQKWLGSKVGESRVGRKSLIRFLGQEADHILTAMRQVSEKQDGKSKAKEYYKAVLKIVTKVALLWKNNLITEELAMPLRDPLLGLATQITEALAATPPPSELRPIVEQVAVVKRAVLPLLTAYMKPRSWHKWEIICDYYGGEDYLQFLFHREEAAAEKTTIADLLSLLMQPFQTDLKATLLCAVRGCLRQRVMLPGATYCEFHHIIHVRERLESPELRRFLEDASEERYFREFLPADQLPLLQFWHAAEDFRKVTSRTLLESRAARVFDKYLAPSAPTPVSLPPRMVAKVEQALDKRPRATLFRDLQRHAFSMLNDCFPAFLRSERYSAFVASQTVDVGLDIPYTRPPGVDEVKRDDDYADSSDDDDGGREEKKEEG